MPSVVLDSSAVLAAIQNETGADLVLANLENAAISAVNLAEVLTKILERGEFEMNSDVEEALQFVTQIEVVSFDKEHALSTAKLRAKTRHRGFSLGDRACLALAIKERAMVLTADRAWADIDVGVKIELVR